MPVLCLDLREDDEVDILSQELSQDRLFGANASLEFAAHPPHILGGDAHVVLLFVYLSYLYLLT